MQHRNHKCLGTPRTRTRTQQPVQWGTEKCRCSRHTAFLGCLAHAATATACCRLLQRRAANEFPRNIYLFENGYLSAKLSLAGCFKDLFLFSEWCEHEHVAKFRWQLYCRSLNHVSRLLQFLRLCCNWLQCLQWCCLDPGWFSFHI